MAYAVEGRRRVKEQMNKRKPDDEFARINLSYFNASGEEVVVYCPESKDALATQQPARRSLGDEGAGHRRGRPGACPRADALQLPLCRDSTGSGSPEPVALRGGRVADAELLEQHFTILYGDTGLQLRVDPRAVPRAPRRSSSRIPISGASTRSRTSCASARPSSRVRPSRRSP